MTSSIVHAPDSASAADVDPQFQHAITPRLMVMVAALMSLLLIAFFIYGQFAPGA